MAGVWTSVCVMFPALDAKAAGFKVYAVIDASGDPSELASRTTLARFAQGGVIPTSTNAVLSELHRTWNRPEAGELAKLYGLVRRTTRRSSRAIKRPKTSKQLRSRFLHDCAFPTRCPLLAQSGHCELHCTYPLSGVKRT